MGFLVLEVLTKPDHLPIARAQVLGISRLSLSQPLSGFYTLLSPTSKKLGELHVSGCKQLKDIWLKRKNTFCTISNDQFCK